MWWMPDSPMKAHCFSEEDKKLMVERVRSNRNRLQNRKWCKEQVFCCVQGSPSVWICSHSALARALHSDITVIHQAAEEFPREFFQWLKQLYLHAWTRVQSKVASGQFHPIGGCWVEHDTNIPSGESLIRQFLFGQRFFRDSAKGDGGGGPTRPQLESLRRLRGLADTTGLLPRVHSDGSPDDFFDRLEKKAHTFPTWHGEFVYANVFSIGNTLLKSIYSVLKINDNIDNPTGTEKLVAPNTLGWPRKEVITTTNGKDLIAQGTGTIITTREITPSETTKPLVTVKEVSQGIFVLENSHFTLTVENGTITSLLGRRAANREVLALGGRANQFVIFDDKPIYWQAWDVEVFHLETREEVRGGRTAVLEESVLRVSVVTETRISEVSYVRSVVSLAAVFDGDEGGADVGVGVECTAEVDWHATMKFLKVEFPVDVRHHEASYDTQFGVIRRPTHYNTSWDMAKFEVCCHKYVDLSEYGYGVSILNDSKYGFATVGNTMRLSLLRSSKAPDDEADMGKHTIRWATLPHRGPLGPETVRAAYEFNNPLKVVSASGDSPLLKVGGDGDGAAGSFPVALTGDENLVLATIKRSEDDEDVVDGELPVRPGRSVVLRVYGSLGGRGRGRVVTRWEVKRVYKTNLLEDDDEEVRVEDGGFKVDLGPFQLQTYRLELAD
ncbi:glycosyl hydrolase family 38 domain-containing protein [Colletotrichum salicis]|uniref:alpha-mannosidase n=1 Tax=Colletotrichum salicis TaxID=1209931 RepID=A0A135RYQ9_9PEZI|nr:glycosyl hydrolase family 38 domain-containing protein [Colletotrichum salicis]